jgi:hypothetical protein
LEDWQVGIRVFVFDERAALAQADYSEWVESEIRAAARDGWDKPESSRPRLHEWFDDMRKTFPREAHPDDPYGTEYCFYKNVIDVMFASSVGEEGVLEAWRLAEKHGIRLLAGDELLPRAAPNGKRDFHISILDGRKPDRPGVVPNVCFVVFDPELAQINPGDSRMRILELLETQPWTKDQANLVGRRLRQWNDQFAARRLDPLVSEMRFYRELVFVRVHARDSGAMISPMMDLSRKLGLPLEVFTNLA